MIKEHVNHPEHYLSSSGVECIEIIRSFGFNLGSSFKYLWRKDKKESTIKDVKKALWYINDEIASRSILNLPLDTKDGYKGNFYIERSKKLDNHVRISISKHIGHNDLLIYKLYSYLNYADYFVGEIEILVGCKDILTTMIDELEEKTIKN